MPKLAQQMLDNPQLPEAPVALGWAQGVTGPGGCWTDGSLQFIQAPPEDALRRVQQRHEIPPQVTLRAAWRRRCYSWGFPIGKRPTE
ncbi:hypothetical protein D3C73_1300260 [compost metagenome]